MFESQIASGSCRAFGGYPYRTVCLGPLQAFDHGRTGVGFLVTSTGCFKVSLTKRAEVTRNNPGSL